MQAKMTITMWMDNNVQEFSRLVPAHLYLVGNPNRKKMHIFGFVGIFEYIC